MTTRIRSAAIASPFLFLWFFFSSPPVRVHALATSSSSATSSATAACQELGIDFDELRRTVSQGRVYQKENFLTEDEVQSLLNDMNDLEAKGHFQRSGLSNTVKGDNQNFGNRDRSICTVPWWKDVIHNNNNNNNNKDNNSVGVEEDGEALVAAVKTKLRQLRQELAETLQRPTLVGMDLPHECYYSKSTVGSFLPRHMDERHEELKGSKGWLLPSRRSLSWLIYLSDAEWDLQHNGGALRSFPQQSTTQDNNNNNLHHHHLGSTHEGNLQIGWLLPRSDPSSSSQPVYLDSWYPLQLPNGDNEFHCVLYVVENNETRQRRYITKPWLSEGLGGVSVPAFLKTYRNQLFLVQDDNYDDAAARFVLLEDRQQWDEGHEPEGTQPVDVTPLRGSLVVFDSVTVPHEVSVIKSGTRSALAGWFHEETQAFPMPV